MGVRPTKAVREERMRMLKPLFDQMRLQRMSNRYMADKLGMPEKRFWAYQHGETRIPENFIAQVCEVVGLAPSLIPIPEPRDRYLQQPPRKNRKKTQAQDTRKTRRSRGDGRRRRRSDDTADTPDTLPNSGAGGGGSDLTSRRLRRSPQPPQTGGADDLPPSGRTSRRVARQPHGALTVMTDLDAMSSSVASDL